MRTTKVKPSSVNLNALLFVLNVAALATLATLSATGVFKGEQGRRGVIGFPGYGSNTSESFAVAYAGGLVLDTVDVPEVVTNWTDTVDTLAYPDFSPRALFRALTYGSFNLNTGTFTVGVNGTYRISFQQSVQGNDGSTYAQVLINGVGSSMSLFGDAAFFNGVLRLVEGDVLQITLTSNGASSNVVPPTVISLNPPYTASYILVWGMDRTS